MDEEFTENKDEHNLRGIQNQALFISAIEEPKQTFNKQDLYKDVLEKAACYMRSIARNHAFYNGNKRTALLATVMFLEQNGYEVTADNKKMYKLTETVVTQKLEISSIKRRLKKFTKEVPRKRKMTIGEIIENTFRKLRK